MCRIIWASLVPLELEVEVVAPPFMRSEDKAPIESKRRIENNSDGKFVWVENKKGQPHKLLLHSKVPITMKEVPSRGATSLGSCLKAWA